MCVCIFLYNLVKIVFTFDIFNFQIKDDNSDCHLAKICFETRIAKMNFPDSQSIQSKKDIDTHTHIHIVPKD